MKDERERAREFLDMIEHTRQTRTAELLGEARAEAAAIVRRARAEARAEVHRAVLEAREQSARDLDVVRAALGTEGRMLEQDAHRAALEIGMRTLRETLAERWRDPAMRRAWIDALILAARAVLPDAPWRVEHPPGFEPAELTIAAATAPAADIVAGLRISAGSARLDGTIEGLLARRGDVEGRLLAEVDAHGS